MNFNELTNNIALITLVLYGIYALFVMGIGSVILSSAIGLIAAAFFDRLEIIAAVVVISGMVVAYLLKQQAAKAKEGFTVGADATAITGRIQKMMNARVQGVYSPTIEGYASAYNSIYGSARSGLGGLTEGFQDVAEAEGAASASTPASTERKNEVQIAIGAPTPAEEKKDVAAAVAAVPPAAAPKDEEPFKSQAGLFKLGELPSESKEGPFLDAGSTLMKAVGALQPDQIKSMTEETKKMIDTQKNMISMLHSMRPVLQDGQQLLQSFSSIFGSGSSPFKLTA